MKVIQLQRNTGTTHDNPVGGSEQGVMRPPTGQAEKSVRTDEDEEGVLRFRLTPQGSQRVDGVIGRAIWAWGVESGRHKLRLGSQRLKRAKQGNHLEPILKRSGRSIRFQWLPPGRNDQDLIECESFGSCARNG